MDKLKIRIYFSGSYSIKGVTLIYFNTVTRWTHVKTVKKDQVEIGLSFVFSCTSKYKRNIL